jgi:excisionase family DNA binding protein
MTTDATPLLTVRQVAEELQIGKTTTFRLLASGAIPSIRIGGKLLRVRRADLDRWLAERTGAA